MLSNRIFTFTLCGIIFVFNSLGAKAAPPYEERVDVGDLLSESNLQPYLNLDQEEPNQPINDYTDRKFKRQTPTGKKQNIEEILQKLPIPIERLKEFLRTLNEPPKPKTIKLGGWSANGMPFNVLYTPNLFQPRLLNAQERKPVPKPASLSQGNYVTAKKEPNKESVRPDTRSTRNLKMRKHYLNIPQLFVSYGWDSVGK